MTVDAELLLSLETAAGGSATLCRTSESSLRLEWEEPAPRRARLLRTLAGGPLLGALVFVLHYALSLFDLELRYALYAAPCCHPLLGFGLAYGAARWWERRHGEGASSTTITIGSEVHVDGVPQGRLVRVEQDLAAARLTLRCANGEQELRCREPSDVVALAHAIGALPV